MTFREMEKIIKADGWCLVRSVGSHHHYKHPVKTGMVSIPKHPGDLKKAVVHSIYKQAGLKK